MKIITTVGTSLLTNYFDKDKNKKSGNSNYLSFYKDKLKGRTFSENDWNNIQNDDYFKNFKKELLDNWIKTDNSCAEIKTLKKLENENQNYHFLTTNTLDGYFVGEIICDHFELDKEIYLHKIEGLQIDNAQKFKDIGINKLIETIKKIKDDNKDGEVILNISGGYKALIPILTIIGQLENIPLKYIYEDSSALIEIPDLQIDFDITFIEEHYTAFELLKKEKQNLPLSTDFYHIINNNEIVKNWIEKDKIIEEFDYNNQKKIKFSYLGKLIFEKYEELYNKNLLHRQNLVSKLVEMYIFEYYANKQLGVSAGKKVGEQNYDVDVYLENEQCIHAIEVKPGAHIPTNDIIKVFKEKAFNWIVSSQNNKKLKFEVILYHYKKPLEVVINGIKEQIEKMESFKNQEIIFTWLDLDSNYKTNMNWKVSDDRLKTLFQINPFQK